MPSKTAKQARTMQAAAHNPEFAKKVGIPMSVAKEFNQADMRKKKRSLVSHGSPPADRIYTKGK
jgi:hypothetical protein